MALHYIEPFILKTFPVLPTQFDDSLSYYEAVNKVVIKLNEGLAAINSQNDQLTEWHTQIYTDIGEWEQDVLDALNSWKNDTEDDITQWKNDTLTDFNHWLSETLAALNEWKEARDEEYDELAQRTEQAIEIAETSATAAASSATSASDSATSASNSATEAANSAESVAAEATQIATNTTDISYLKTQINEIENLQTTAPLNATWEIGTFQTNGSVLEIVKRIRTAAKIKFTHTARLTIENGYRYYIWYYVAEDSNYCDTTRADEGKSGWIDSGTDYTVDANTWCNITIAKVHESGTYEADVDTWKTYIAEVVGGLLVPAVMEANRKADENAQSITSLQVDMSNAEDDINTNTNTINFINFLGSLDAYNVSWEIGTFKTNGSPNTENTKRIKTSAKVKFDTDIKLDTINGYRYIVWYYVAEDSVYCDTTRADGGISNWIDSGTDYTVDADTWCNISIAKIDESGTYEADVNTWKNYIFQSASGKIVPAIMNLEKGVEELTELTDEQDDRIDNIEEQLSTDTLPDYWNTYLENKKSTVLNSIFTVGNHGAIFAFFTDFHYDKSDFHYTGKTNLPLILKYCKNNYDIVDIINGGDVLQSYATEQEAIDRLQLYKTDFNDLGIKNVYGNHDNNPYAVDQEHEPAPINTDTVYSIMFRGMNMEKETNLQPNMYWYADNTAQKIRYIALNTWGKNSDWQSDSEQHEWLINVLTNTPDGYTIIIIPHIFFGLDSNQQPIISTLGTNIKTLIDAYCDRGTGTWNTYSYNFTNCNGIVACIICGHVHNDSYIMSESGYPIISVVCDAVAGSKQNVHRDGSDIGTINEHAFDIVCVDTTAKTIKCVRIGSGSDRNFGYTT